MFVEKRAEAQRDRCAIDATIRLPAVAQAVACLITDLTERGAAIWLDAGIALPKRFHLAVPLLDEVDHERAVELRWRKGPVAGLMFLAG